MSRLIIIGMSLVLLSSSLFAQEEIKVASSTISPTANSAIVELELELAALAKTIMTDSLKENRISANTTFLTSLEKALSMKGAYEYPFDSLTSIPILQPEDKSFRIFTWQLYEDINDYSYFGIIQMKGEEPVLHVLNDQSATASNQDIEYEVLDKNSWYGALYYEIKEYKSKEGKRYLLFGFDGYKFFHKRKIADVLVFENDQPAFGAPVFEPEEMNRPDLTKNRLVLTYSAASAIRLNYDPSLDIIIFDNLIENPAPIKGQGYSLVSDGSYQGYKFKKGRWSHVDKIFDHVYEKAPRPSPILDNRSRDINGN